MVKSINQLVRHGRPDKKRGTPKLSLGGSPQKSGVCLRVYTAPPRKPNSAIRKVTRVRLSSGIEVIAYIPGIGHSLQEHSVVLVKKGKVKDLPGVKFVVCRGVSDCQAVQGRKTSRSKYGAKKLVVKKQGS